MIKLYKRRGPGQKQHTVPSWWWWVPEIITRSANKMLRLLDPTAEGNKESTKPTQRIGKKPIYNLIWKLRCCYFYSFGLNNRVKLFFLPNVSSASLLSLFAANLPSPGVYRLTTLSVILLLYVESVRSFCLLRIIITILNLDHLRSRAFAYKEVKSIIIFKPISVEKCGSTLLILSAGRQAGGKQAG